jgi:2-oxoglutarate dehydrogenase E2 component (dihydrolipoamide succinyltransferase)
MSVEIRVPTLGESVTEATVARWLKQPGEWVERDEPVVELETDKVTLEVPAPEAGVIGAIHVQEGGNVPVGAVLGTIADGAGEAAPHPGPHPASGERESTAPATKLPLAPQSGERGGPAPPGSAQSAARGQAPAREDEGPAALDRAGPAVRKLVAESGIDVGMLTPTGPGGRLTKADVIAARGAPLPAPPQPSIPPPEAAASPTAARERPPVEPPPAERETRVRMTRLRRRIAERLKQAQQNAAMLTTFNEIDMSAAMTLRERWREAFEKKHGIRLGFMSIFVKAAIVALKELPAVNAEIDGDDIVYKNHYDIGVAVGTEHGLVVPVVRDADLKSFADIEKEIAALGRKARDGRLTIEDLSGGTFTISNGGVYGSLLSTPILNPPQSAILGMHKIERRPIAVGDPGAERIEIRPMMYVALTYDHRIIDGREAVTFLVRIKECVEDPSRLLFDI